MNDWVKRAVAGGFGVAGGWLIGAGVVSPEAWAGVANEDVIVAISGVVTVVVYGVVNWAMTTAANVFRGEKTVEVQVSTATGQVTEVKAP